jgi:large conductance mechanosensitive channel
MSIMADFKKFAFKGNVIDLAVGVVIGAAFGKIVSALVADVIMPLVALAMPSGDWRASGFILREGATPKENVVLQYGDLLGAILDFFIIAFVLFVIVSKIISAAESKFKRAEPEPAKAAKECPFCLETVPAKATRCKACTSQFT